MQYVLAVKSGLNEQGAYLAYQIAESLLTNGHNISQIFFFQNGVHNANVLVDPASDEFNLVHNWRILAEAHSLPLHLCISAAQRRGVIEQNLAYPFILAGLGEFSQAILKADRLLTF